MHGMNSTEQRTGKRLALFKKYGFDTKYAMNLVRLCLECEQILLTEDLDLRRDKEHLKAIRNGEVSKADIEFWFREKEKYLNGLYHTSKLRHSPDKAAIKDLLLKCLEHHYGSLAKAIERPDQYQLKLNKIRDILDS